MIGAIIVLLSGALLLTGDWVGGWLLGWPLWLRIVLTFVIVLLVVAWFVSRRLIVSMRARALERDILKQGEDQALNARPDRRAEIVQLQMQMKRGIEALKESKLGAAQGGALYSLPWYLVMGPPGSGKSTALKHSGLVFPYLDPERGGVRGVGGTRNCDWWFTNEGILLDTAGRYATDGSDHEEWTSFLGFLKKYRPRKPINGIIVAVSVSDLAGATEEQIEAYAGQLRQRIDEVANRLQMIVPIYVMFTKADLVDGFAEFWRDLRKSDRAQIFGFTLPISTPEKREAAQAFETEFDLLVESVHARGLKRIGEERVADDREKIFHYPLELYALKENLADFLGAVFRPNAYRETPVLRGVYFTSGTREGKPFARVIGGMLRAFNLAAPEPQEAAPDVEAKSYFVTDLFRRVVFPDKDIASWTAGEARRQLIQRIVLAALTVVVAGCLLLPASCSWVRNRDLVRTTEKLADDAASINWNDSSSIADKIRRLDGVRDQLRELDTWRTEGAPLGYRWGMYTGNDLYVPFRGAYIASLHTGFAMPTKARLEDELRTGDQLSSFTPEQYNTYFNRLKAYLEACDRDKLEVPWESSALTEGWGRALNTGGRLDKEILKTHVGYYVELMKRGEVPLWVCDQTLIGRLRAKLRAISREDRDFSSLIRDANEYAPSITRETVFLNTAFGTFVKSKSTPEIFVPGAYTKVGWESYVRDRFGKDRVQALATDAWVIGESDLASLARSEKQIAELRDRYFTSYQRAWADFLKDLDVRRPANNDEALDELNALSEVPWPYLRLLRILAENTRLEEQVAEKVGEALLANAERQAEQKLKQSNPNTTNILIDGGVLPAPATLTPKRWISPPEAAFEPMNKFGVPWGSQPPNAEPPKTQLLHYQEQIIGKLVSMLTDLRDSKGRGVEPKAVAAAFTTAIRSTNELLTPSQNGFTRPILSPLLLNPIELSWKGVLGDLQGPATSQWETEVWSKWHEQLEDGYPFTDTWRDVKLGDYTEFFKPGGALFAFYDANLTSTLDRRGSKFVPATKFKASIIYTNPFIRCYERGQEISADTFPAKSEVPLVEFETNLHSVSDDIAEVTFEINGVSRTYKNAPEEWIRVRWPAKEGAEAASRVKIKGYSGLEEEIVRPGEWGLFRLLDAARTVATGTEGGRPGGRPTIVATWTMRTQEQSFVKMDIRPLREDNPFKSYVARREQLATPVAERRVFRGYLCPRVMSAGVR